MTGTHLKWIGGAVVALLLLWGGARLLPWGTDAGADGFRIAAVAADSVDTIVVAAVRETVVLARAAPGRWSVNGFAASSTAVAELFTALGEDAPVELVAQRTASFARLGVDSGAARRLRVIHGGRTPVDLFVSERGPDHGSVYVRTPGDSAVYALAGRLAGIARRSPDDWRDRTVASVISDSVREVDLERGRRRSLLRLRDGAWRLGAGPADTTAVRRLLERYRAVSASGFPTAAQLDSAFRGRVERRATLRGAAGATLLTLEFDSTAGGFWVRRPGTGRDAVYRLNVWDVDALVPADSSLR